MITFEFINHDRKTMDSGITTIIGVVIGGTISAIATWFVSERTFKNELKKEELKIINQKIDKLCFLKDNAPLFTNRHDLNGNKLFEFSRIFRSCSYLFSENDSIRIIDKINECGRLENEVLTPQINEVPEYQVALEELLFDVYNDLMKVIELEIKKKMINRDRLIKN